VVLLLVVVGFCLRFLEESSVGAEEGLGGMMVYEVKTLVKFDGGISSCSTRQWHVSGVEILLGACHRDWFRKRGRCSPRYFFHGEADRISRGPSCSQTSEKAVVSSVSIRKFANIAVSPQPDPTRIRMVQRPSVSSQESSIDGVSPSFVCSECSRFFVRPD